MNKFVFALFPVSVLTIKVSAQISFAPEVGLNVATMSMKVNDLASGSFTYGTEWKAGLAVGGVADIGITGNIYFQPGLFYEMTGVKLPAGYQLYSNGEWDINTLTIPLNFEYKTGEKGGNRFFIGTGPYIGYNFSAGQNYNAGGTYNYYTNSTSYNPAYSGSLKIGNSAGIDFIKPLDLGWGINTGYQLAIGLYLRVHYQMGFTNLDPYSDKYDVYKSSAYGVTLGYLFGGHTNHNKKGSSRNK
jgi:hypothetical protein